MRGVGMQFALSGDRTRNSVLTAGTSASAHASHGLVAVDIKSHQSDLPIPYATIVAGNEQQDVGCTAARSHPLPCDVWWPTGGLAFQLSSQAKIVTSPSRQFFRLRLRSEALSKWKARTVQGKLGYATHIFQPGLDLRLFRNCRVPERWQNCTLDGDASSIDLSAFAYRCIRAIGGSWTERLHSDPRLLQTARDWATRLGLHHRTCPLCQLRQALLLTLSWPAQLCNLWWTL